MVKQAQFIDLLAKRGYTKKEARYCVTDFVRLITELLVSGESVQFYGFGTFYIKELAPRDSTDVRTGKPILIPGHRTPKFIPSDTLKQGVREGMLRD